MDQTEWGTLKDYVRGKIEEINDNARKRGWMDHEEGLIQGAYDDILSEMNEMEVNK